jgi:hypothetical protein
MNIEQFQECLDDLEDAAIGYNTSAPHGVVESARKSLEKLRALFAGKVLVPVEPTERMLDALYNFIPEKYATKQGETMAYKSMLTASQEQGT